MLISSSLNYRQIEPHSITPDQLHSLGSIMHEHWSEVDHPLNVRSIEGLERLLQIPDRINLKSMYFVAQTNEGKIISYIRAWLNTGSYNQEYANLQNYTLPEYRRQNIMKNLFLKAVQSLPEHITKINIWIRVDKAYPFYLDSLSLINYLKSKQIKQVFTSRQSVSNLKQFDIQKVVHKAQEYKDLANKNGYSLLFLNASEYSTQKFFDLEKYVSMYTSIDNDMPREEGDWEDIQLTVSDFLSLHKYHKRLNQDVWIFVAIENSTGFPVGMTDTYISKDVPEVAYQGDTGVLRAHRGKRLGISMKYQMLAKLLTDPLGLTKKFWVTYNAYSNKYMIRINDDLQYKEKAISKGFEISREQILNELSA
ncbi:MAG: GNAT family N-acetyltransferase [Candidatus Thorarchaeota archaeon]